jgi:hypothetical protein
MRCKKLSSFGSVASALQHCYRERETANADAELTQHNEHLTAASSSQALGRLREMLPEKRRKDAVLAIEYLMTASPDFWKQASQEQQADFFAQSKKWLADKYGPDRIIAATVHRDESTPHLSAFVVPLTKDNRLSAKEFIGDRKKMQSDQTTYSNYVEHLGLSRGIEGSKSRHTKIKSVYGAIESASEPPEITDIPPEPSLIDRLLRPEKITQRERAKAARADALERLKSAAALGAAMHPGAIRSQAARAVAARAAADDADAEARAAEARAEASRAAARVELARLDEIKESVRTAKEKAEQDAALRAAELNRELQRINKKLSERSEALDRVSADLDRVRAMHQREAGPEP